MEEQIVSILKDLKEYEAGAQVDKLCRCHCISSQLQNSTAFPGLDFDQAQAVRICRLRRNFIIVIAPYRLELSLRLICLRCLWQQQRLYHQPHHLIHS
ncbi:MAG: hypothetical protein AAFR90_04660 [Pseudomonadota bacterium]